VAAPITRFLYYKATRCFFLSPGWDASPSQDTQHNVTRSITTPPGWDASPSQDTQHKVTGSVTTPLDGMLIHHRIPSIK